MAEEPDAVRVDAVATAHVVDECHQVADVVDVLRESLAACIGRVPELVAERILGAVGVHVQEAALFGQRLQPEVGLLDRARRSVAVFTTRTFDTAPEAAATPAALPAAEVAPGAIRAARKSSSKRSFAGIRSLFGKSARIC